MKNLFKTFKKSIFNPAFYQEAAKGSLSEALRYYLKSSLVLSLVTTAALGLFLSVAGTKFIKNYAPNLVKNYYPTDLVLHIEKGEASANVSMPYFVPVRTMTGATSTTNAIQNFLVIDTTHDFDKKTFEGYKTYALLTKTDLITGNDAGQITIQSLRRTPTMTISQAILFGWIARIQESQALIITLGFIVMFLIFMSGFLVYLAVLLLFALIPLLVAWLRKTPLTYGGAYKMSLYAIVPALVVKTILNLIGLFFLPSYLTLLVFMLVIALNMREGVEQPTLFKK